MKVKVLRSYCLGNGIDTKPGEVLEMSDKEASIKIRQGKVKDAALSDKKISKQKQEVDEDANR